MIDQAMEGQQKMTVESKDPWQAASIDQRS